MPVDEQGVRCDIVFNPQAVPNRMSPSQLYETGINRITLFVQKQAIQLRRSESALKAVEYIVDYIKELNPAYAELKAGPVLLRDPESYMDYVESQDTINELGIFMMIPPFNKHITPEKIKHLKNKYNVITSPVTFVRTDPVTNTKERKTTKSNVCVSSKYVFVLYNIPQAKAPGVGHINQFKIPVKPNPKSKFMSPIGLTPLRIGEDEGRIMTMCAGPSAVTRLMGIHSNSCEAVGRTMETLLTVENPSKIERVDITDDEIRRTNNVVGVANHMMATMGIDMSHINCEVFDEVDFAANILSRDSGKF